MYEDSKKVVNSVQFPTVRYPQLNNTLHIETITFKEPVTELDAVIAAEKFLNEPVTEQYFTPRVDSLFDDSSQHTDYEIRGEMLTDMIYLEQIMIVDGKMEMRFGS